jgi:hypothetical protein
VAKVNASHRARRTTCGYASLQAIMLMLALTAVVSSGLRAREQEMAGLGRNTLRVCARWAAEAGVTQARAALDRGNGRWSGTLGHRDRRYDAELSAAGPNRLIRAEGACRSGAGETVAKIEIEIERRRDDWQPTSRRESSRRDR